MIQIIGYVAGLIILIVLTVYLGGVPLPFTLPVMILIMQRLGVLPQ